MNYLVSYDIKHDGLRTKVSHKLIYFGLTRVQYSVFMGVLSPPLKSQLSNWLDECRKKDFQPDDKLMVLPLHDGLLAKLELLGNNHLDLGEIFGKKHTLIL